MNELEWQVRTNGLGGYTHSAVSASGLRLKVLDYKGYAMPSGSKVFARWYVRSQDGKTMLGQGEAESVEAAKVQIMHVLGELEGE